jgi:uncharacterized protein (TIGR02231 family)
MSTRIETVRPACVAVFGLWIALAAAGAAEPPANRVTRVTLYQGQALVTRSVPVEGAKGAREIVVPNLPEQVIPPSLYAEGSEGVEVRAVRFRAQAVGQEPREEVRKIDAAIKEINEKMQANKKGQEVLAKRSAYLDQLENFTASTAKTDLARGFLDATALQKLSLFSFEQRTAAAKELLALENEAKQLNEQLALQARQREELTKGASHTVREAVLFVEKRAEGAGTVQLNYLVQSCGWSPTYTFRAGKDGKEVAVECSAQVQQVTGEDWKDVALTLSTASPALSAAGMGLAPFPISLVRDTGRKLSTTDLAQQLQAIRGRQSEAQVFNQNAVTLAENIASSWTVNTAANDLQSLELASGEDVLNMMHSHDAQAVGGPSLSYQLAGTVNLASRSDQQMVRILQTAFKGRFYYVATPVLTNYVYREAELINTSPEDLLSGPITVYMDGRFVGRSEIPTVARGQTFVVGFGVDPQLRSARELASRTENVQGGNRELSFKYRLVLENYKDEPAEVHLFDRLPYSDRPNDVRIKLGDLQDPLSKDEYYRRTEQPKGILRWDINVAAGATGEKVRKVEYSFTLDFDRTFSLYIRGASPPTAAPAAPAIDLQQEYEMQQRARLTK